MKETIVNKTKSQFFEKINKIDKPLARLKKKRENNPINKIRNEKGEVKTDNLEEMDKFLERYNLPRVNQEETENINRPIPSNEIETVIKNLNKSP